VQNIKDHQKITSGVIVKYMTVAFSSPDFEFKFTANDKTYWIRHGVYGNYDWQHSIGMTFPVIYDSLDPYNYSSILVLPSDFERFYIPLPDSLK